MRDEPSMAAHRSSRRGPNRGTSRSIRHIRRFRDGPRSYCRFHVRSVDASHVRATCRQRIRRRTRRRHGGSDAARQRERQAPRSHGDRTEPFSLLFVGPRENPLRAVERSSFRSWQGGRARAAGGRGCRTHRSPSGPEPGCSRSSPHGGLHMLDIPFQDRVPESCTAAVIIVRKYPQPEGR